MPHNWINKLNESNSRIHKETIIAQALNAANLGSKDAKIFLSCAWNAYNPYIVFNFKRVPVFPDQTGKENPYDEFWKLLDKLKNREITGNAAEIEVEKIAYYFDTDVWETLLRPTILKDLRVGATIKTFNKILKGTEYEIPVFECQLASDSEKHEKKLVGKKILEPKLDGVRVLAVVNREFPFSPKNNKVVALYSRNGKQLTNFPHIEDQLARQFDIYSKFPWNETHAPSFVFDGEIVSENFQALMKQAHRKTDINTADSVYTIFDVIPLHKFQDGKWNMAQRKRTREWLGAIRDEVNNRCSSIHIIDGIEVDLDTNEGHDQMRRYAEEHVAMGYEGIMIKDVDAPYQCKRGTNWMKWKPTISVDLTVVAIEEGTGRNKGRLGALVCEGIDQKREIKVNVGSGFSDMQRDNFWKYKDEVIGSIVEVKADAVTQNQDGTYSLRFPRFMRFRGFEAGEKM